MFLNRLGGVVRNYNDGRPFDVFLADWFEGDHGRMLPGLISFTRELAGHAEQPAKPLLQ